MTPRAAGRLRMPRNQRGVMLIIALIVLVAMTLAGIGMMRSVDTANVVAGNIAFRQSAVTAADQGIQAGYAWLLANINTLSNDNAVAGYFSSAPPNEPDWTNGATWAGAALLNGGVADASGNIQSYFIHRLCTIPNCVPGGTCLGATNICASTPQDILVSGEGTEQSQASTFTLPPQIHYRVTVRSVGPRNTGAIVQTMMRVQ